MKNKLSGFTLIELLVVVLIIGILAAIAVPQYTKAVRKARAAEAKTNLRTLANAVDMYVIQNGSQNSDLGIWESLDIELPRRTKYWEYDIQETSVLVASPLFEEGYSIWLYGGIGNWEFVCSPSREEGEQICKELGAVGEGGLLIFP